MSAIGRYDTWPSAAWLPTSRGLGALLTNGGAQFVSGKIFVTITEIVETSSTAKMRGSLDQVERIDQEPIYGEELNRRLPGPDSIIGRTLVLRDSAGTELYRVSPNLEPAEDFQGFVNALSLRFPVKTQRTCGECALAHRRGDGKPCRRLRRFGPVGLQLR